MKPSRALRIADIEVDWPAHRLPLDPGDPLLAAIEPAGAVRRRFARCDRRAGRGGKSLVLQRLGAALAGLDGFELELIAVGVRPEELTEYRALAYFTAPAAPSRPRATCRTRHGSGGRARSRVAVRGGNAILLIDSLDGLGEAVARRALDPPATCAAPARPRSSPPQRDRSAARQR